VEDRATHAQELGALVKQSIGVTVNVDVVEPESIERSLGKAKRLVDLRQAPTTRVDDA
jgi:phenylacetate-CoA ligase